MNLRSIFFPVLFIACLFIVSCSDITGYSAYEQKDMSIVSFTFDDGYESQYYNAYPIFSEENVPATLFVVTNLTYFEGKKLMDDSMLKKVSKKWEIGSHSMNHKDIMGADDEIVKNELLMSKNHLKAKGFDVIGYSSNYGRYDDNIVKYARMYYTYMRTSDPGINDIERFDRYRLKSRWIEKNTTIDEMKSWVDQIANEGGWLIISIHNVDQNDYSDQYNTRPSDLKILIEYIKKKDIPIKTIGDVVGMEKT